MKAVQTIVVFVNLQLLITIILSTECCRKQKVEDLRVKKQTVSTVVFSDNHTNY